MVAFDQFLTNDELIQIGPNFRRFGHPHRCFFFPGILLQFLIEDTFTESDTTVADIDAGTGDKFTHLAVALAAERAHCQIARAGHEIKRVGCWGFLCEI